MIRAVLFDLDGTFADTAPDLGLALNLLRESYGLLPLPHETIRPVASHGARGLLGLGFGISPEQDDFERLRSEYLRLYEDLQHGHSALFAGMPEVLQQLGSQSRLWGIVTNKPERFTRPLMRALGLAAEAATVVSGDTCPQPKPHPAPMLHACAEMGLAPDQCLYVGDAQRDVVAAHAAGMPALVAGWGYLAEDDRPQAWGADAIIDQPQDILIYLKSHG